MALGYVHRMLHYSYSSVYFIYIDGHHKLVRWRFVTHCSIDGFSRLILFLQCSNNNQASTVYNLFLESVEQHGLPSRIRCDQSTENVLVVRYMLHHRGEERRSVLVGSSVHNQRVERLWRDSHRCVTSLYYRLFYYMEHNSLLDPINEVHLFSLHYVFLPRINSSLQHFKEAWNCHGLRTEGGHTPNQLFTMGVLRLRHSGMVAVDFFDSVEEEYGREEDGGTGTDEGAIRIPRILIDLDDIQLHALRESIHPLQECNDYGISIYSQTVQLLRSWNF